MVRPACSKDYGGVEKLVCTLDMNENLLRDLKQYNKARRDNVSTCNFIWKWLVFILEYLLSYTSFYLNYQQFLVAWPCDYSHPFCFTNSVLKLNFMFQNGRPIQAFVAECCDQIVGIAITRAEEVNDDISK